MDDIPDFYRWTQEQADALRRRAGNALDWDGVAEELEDMGRSDKRSIKSHLCTLLAHLLKRKYASVQQARGEQRRWANTIEETRFHIDDGIAESPSLKNYPSECLPKAYRLARLRAGGDIGRDDLPKECPWTIEQVLDANFLP